MHGDTVSGSNRSVDADAVASNGTDCSLCHRRRSISTRDRPESQYEVDRESAVSWRWATLADEDRSLQRRRATISRSSVGARLQQWWSAGTARVTAAAAQSVAHLYAPIASAVESPRASANRMATVNKRRASQTTQSETDRDGRRHAGQGNSESEGK
jgi:hypothetical protein